MSGALERPADHVERLGAARRWAAYNLGDADWADIIVAAYLDPDAAHEQMDNESVPE